MRYVTLPLLAVAALPALSQDAGAEYFEKKVRPLFAKNCTGCHSAKIKSGGLDLSTTEGIAAGGHTGPLFVKGKPEESLLMKVLSYDERLKMPPSGRMAAADQKGLAVWIQAGAPGVAAAPTGMQTRKHGRGLSDADRQFWSFQPLSNPQPPAVRNSPWVKSPVDNFILAKLESKGLKPSAPADRAALLRRVTFALTGLAPTPEETRSFLAEPSLDRALETAIDRMLASPRYGEHWGRHWLDVARYADSTGNDEDHRYPYAYRYRDYVIESFNNDVPYDQFVREQIAGDLMPPAPGEKVNRRGIVATGFLALGAKAVAQQDKKKMLVDVYDEQIDVVSKGILGLTMACARCHDHKFDPILTKDYYSWNTIFAATRNFKNPDQHVASLLYRPLAPEEEYERFLKGRELSDRKRGEMLDLIEDQTSAYTLELGSRTAEYMLAARAVLAGKKPAAINLKPNILEKWVTFLEESRTKRSYLKDWFDATDATAPQIAAKYQARYLAKQSDWTKAMVRTRKARRNRNLAMPPKIAADDDVFFFDVHYAGPYGLKESEWASAWPPAKVATIQKLDAEVKAILADMPPEPDMACAVAEGGEGVVAGKVYIRGDYNALGEDAPKGIPEVLSGVLPAPEFPPSGSGRLELAQWLTRPENPLTARVFVNRVWYWLFGEGLVRTPDNFGRMGEKPTHPELLDFLAQQFIQNGWSVKKLQKMILLSNAYRMSSLTNDETVAKDPDNSLLSRFPRRRLSVEELRDSMLWIDGSIDLTMGGTMQSGFGTDGENSSDRLSIRPDDVKRRTVYLPLRRANLPGLLNLFDFGDATSSASKRPNTTIAPQALFLMNSDFIAERARNLSKQSADNAANHSERLRSLYLKTLGRDPSASEIDDALSYLNRFQQKFAGKRPAEDAWFSYTRILLASNEYIYLD
jgi:cytochrome c553